MKRRLLISLMALVVLVSIVILRPVPLPRAEPQPRFIKLDASGAAMHEWAGPWTCVLDQQTGLVWENKTDSESIHDGYWSYSWFDGGRGVENGGDCYFEPDRCDTQDLLRRTRSERLCGLADWRLPSSAELQTLVNHDTRAGLPTIHPAFFAHTHRGDYWTAQSGQRLDGVYAHLRRGALAVSFLDGQPRALPYRNAAFLRLVAEANDGRTNDP